MISQSRVSNDRRSDRPAVQRRRGACIALTLAALLSALPHGARAADWPEEILRGSLAPSSSVRWDGINLGVQAGAVNMNADFGNSTGALVGYILRNTIEEAEYQPSSWTSLPSTVTTGRSYGAFLGYSTQMEQLVLGADLGYNRMSQLEATATDSMSRQFRTSNGFYHQMTIVSSSSSKLVDYGTFRVRAGYAMGQFLPYATLGAAVGRFDYSSTARVIHSGTDVGGGGGAPFSNDETRTEGKNNAIVAGFTAGLGIDVALLPNVFLRGEWEYVGFAPVNGIRTNINTGRVGIGMRF